MGNGDKTPDVLIFSPECPTCIDALMTIFALDRKSRGDAPILLDERLIRDEATREAITAYAQDRANDLLEEFDPENSPLPILFWGTSLENMAHKEEALEVLEERLNGIKTQETR